MVQFVTRQIDIARLNRYFLSIPEGIPDQRRWKNTSLLGREKFFHSRCKCIPQVKLHTFSAKTCPIYASSLPRLFVITLHHNPGHKSMTGVRMWKVTNYPKILLFEEDFSLVWVQTRVTCDSNPFCHQRLKTLPEIRLKWVANNSQIFFRSSTCSAQLDVSVLQDVQQFPSQRVTSD